MVIGKRTLGVLIVILATAAIGLGGSWIRAADNRQERRVRELLRLLKDEGSCFLSQGFRNQTVELRLWGGRINVHAAERIVECERVRWLSTYGAVGGPAQQTLLTTFERQPVSGTEIAHWHRKGSEPAPPAPDPD
jgi:hypothetical protein